MVNVRILAFNERFPEEIHAIEVDRKAEISEPSYVVLVENDSGNSTLIKIFLNNEADCFKDSTCSAGNVFIGCGEKIIFYSPSYGKVLVHRLAGYFGHIYPLSDFGMPGSDSGVLVASSDRLFFISAQGEMWWKSTYLGLDGVIVNHVSDGVIYGAGDFDPPDGWVDFQVRLSDGQRVS